TVLPSPLTRSVKLAMPCPSDLYRAGRGDEDLAAALPALRVGQRGLDLVDGVDALDRRGEDAFDDLIAEVRVDRANLSERARGQSSPEDEADQRLPAADQRAARHHRVVAAHRAVVAHDATLGEARRQPRRRAPGDGVEAEPDRGAPGLGPHRVGEVGTVDDARVGAERLQL